MISGSLINITLRIRSFTAKILRSKLSEHLQEEIKLERKEAVDDWNSMSLSKDFAVSKATAMAQHLIHQVRQFHSLECNVSV